MTYTVNIFIILTLISNIIKLKFQWISYISDLDMVICVRTDFHHLIKTKTLQIINARYILNYKTRARLIKSSREKRYNFDSLKPQFIFI